MPGIYLIDKDETVAHRPGTESKAMRDTVDHLFAKEMEFNSNHLSCRFGMFFVYVGF